MEVLDGVVVPEPDASEPCDAEDGEAHSSRPLPFSHPSKPGFEETFRFFRGGSEGCRARNDLAAASTSPFNLTSASKRVVCLNSNGWTRLERMARRVSVSVSVLAMAKTVLDAQ